MKKKGALLIFLAVIFVLILTNPARYAMSATNGLLVWARFVLPSLFPFFFLTRLLSAFGAIEIVSVKLQKVMKTLFNLPPTSSYPILMSYLSGYPVGAKIISEMYEERLIDENTAKKLALPASTSGVVFVVGSVGGLMFQDVKIGWIIYLSHILGAIILGIVMRSKQTAQATNDLILPKNTLDNVLGEAVYSSVISILLVGGYIILFYVLIDVLFSLPTTTIFINFINNLLQTNLTESVLRGFFEATQGISEVAKICSNKKIASVMACGLISFGGLSINLQNMNFLSKAKISFGYFLPKKLLHALFSMLICLVFVLFL